MVEYYIRRSIDFSVLPCLSYLLDFSEFVASGEEGSETDDTAKCGEGVEDVIPKITDLGRDSSSKVRKVFYVFPFALLFPGSMRNVNIDVG